MLADLPWWIDRLAEAAVGDTCMSESSVGGVYESRYPIHGEDPTAHYLASYPGDADEVPDDKAMNRRYESARRQALAAGGVNERASTLMDAVANTLSTIVRDLLESRGMQIRPADDSVSSGSYRTARFSARWLLGQVGAIAADESAGRVYGEIHELVSNERRDGRIGRVVNRPIAVRDLGRCPTWNEDARSACGAPLRARADQVEVHCRRCRATHKVDRLQLLLINDLARAKVTAGEVLRLNRILPEDYRIPERTLRHWRDKETLKRKGYLRPCSCGHASKHHDRLRGVGCSKCACAAYDGREVINRHGEDDEVLYQWNDITKLRAERWKVNAG